jgi:DNA-binding NarL/FixJ family response regulator
VLKSRSMHQLRVVEGAAIRLVIVENHKLVADSLALMLETQNDFDVVGRAGSVSEAASLPKHLAPDVAILDFHLGDGTGRDAALILRQLYPNARFVFLKSGPASEVIDTVRRVAAGHSLISPATIARLVSRGKDREETRERLSHRELEVLQLMADGVPTRQIATRLGISYSTVRTHVRSISAKLGTRSMLNTVITARELELVN